MNKREIAERLQISIKDVDAVAIELLKQLLESNIDPTKERIVPEKILEALDEFKLSFTTNGYVNRERLVTSLEDLDRRAALRGVGPIFAPRKIVKNTEPVRRPRKKKSPLRKQSSKKPRLI